MNRNGDIMRQEKNMSCEEELLLFYNKYLNVGIGEGFLLELARKYAQNWQIQKSESEENNPSVLFNQLELDFLAFNKFKSVRLAEDYTILIDSLGNIINFLFNENIDLVEKTELERYIHKNIFKLLESLPLDERSIQVKEEVQNMILQNILASKIRKLVFEIIKASKGYLAATHFKNKNANLMNYEEMLKDELDFEELFANKLVFSRSLR